MSFILLMWVFLFSSSISGCGGRILYDIKEAGTIRESKDTSVEDWIDVGTEIADNYNEYNGFVILHGTDTMAFTASALSFMFENLGKPVVLTGAQVAGSIEELSIGGHLGGGCRPRPSLGLIFFEPN